MQTPVLLVHDDVSQIAAVRRLLVNEGCVVTLATSAADAVLAFGNCLPRLVVLAPSIEGGRGRSALEGLARHPDWKMSKLLLLGETIQDCDAPVLAVPLDGAAVLETVRSLLSNEPPSETSQPPSSPSEPNVGGSIADTKSADTLRLAPQPPAIVVSFPSPESPQVPPAELPASGGVSQEQLARLIFKLSSWLDPVCLELRSSPGLRALWIQGGRLIAATSAVEQESLLDRARRDGLIEAHQESEIWLSGATSSVEIVRALLSKGFLRQSEVGPLVQRYVEEVARSAFKEAECAYRISDRSVPRNVAASASSAPTLPIFADAIRQTRGMDFLWKAIGGHQAVPLPLQASAVGLAACLSDEGWDLLKSSNGAEGVDALCAAVGIQLDIGASLFWLAKHLGMLEFKESEVPPAVAVKEIDLERLNAKVREVEEADYFQMLGLPRSAGREEVQQAFAFLSSQFDPLKFVGHPDPKVLERAHQLQLTLAEAAAALRDDDLRQLYAKNLVHLG
jgi:CheY-like chemotaxis protein